MVVPTVSEGQGHAVVIPTVSEGQGHAVAVITVSAAENSSAQLASPFFQSRILANEISMPTFRVNILSSNI